MSTKPIFVATHPRACSTAFERVFMTRGDILHCVHEPFGDAFYFGPERLSERYEQDEAARKKSGFSEVTYKDVMDRLLNPTDNKGKRLFIKDIAHYLVPPDGKPASIAPSLAETTTSRFPNGTPAHQYQQRENANNNPTVIPIPLLRKFHFAFLIRHPRRSIPSYYRCTVPPLSNKTGFHNFMPSEAGYEELRRLFDVLLREGNIGSGVGSNGKVNGATTAGVNGDGGGGAAGSNGVADKVGITVVDADDLLDKPAEVIKAFCEAVGIDYRPEMLKWGNDPDDQRSVEEAFAKWDGFHDDAITSTELKARVHGKKTPTKEQEDEEWRQKYGEEGQRIIRECVDANVPHYEYLKQFAIRV